MQNKKLAIVETIVLLIMALATLIVLAAYYTQSDGNEVAKSNVAKEISVTSEQQNELPVAGVSLEEHLALTSCNSVDYSVTTIYKNQAEIVTQSAPQEEETEVEEEVKKKNYTQEDLERLAHLIFAESGSNTMPDKALYYTGSVVLNRVKSSKYPNTIKKVIAQKGQYGVSGYYMSKKPTKRCYEIAEDLLENGSVLPDDYVGQSGYKTFAKYGSKNKYVKIKSMYFYALRK